MGRRILRLRGFLHRSGNVWKSAENSTKLIVIIDHFEALFKRLKTWNVCYRWGQVSSTELLLDGLFSFFPRDESVFPVSHTNPMNNVGC